MRFGINSSTSLLVMLGFASLSACKGRPGPATATSAPAATYTVGGTLAGLMGSIALANSGADARTPAFPDRKEIS